MSFRTAINRRLLGLTLPGFVFAFTASVQSQQLQYSSALRNGEHQLPVTLSGGSDELRAQLSAGRSAVSVAVADLDRDGTVDLVTGYAVGTGGALTVQSGNPSATAPSGEDWINYTQGRSQEPFAATAQILAVPERPDFLLATDVNGDGLIDLLVAAKGDTNAYLLTGRGKGNFNAPQTIALNGTLTALTTWRQANGSSLVVAGVCGAGGCSLRLLAADGTLTATLALPGAVTATEMARLNAGNLEDIAVAAGDQVLLFNGDSIAKGSAQMETLPVAHALTLSAGNYVYDARSLMQLAVLDAAGTLHVLARAGVDSHQYTPAEIRAQKPWGRGGSPPAGYVDPSPKPAGMAWADIETLPNVGPGDGTVPVMVRGRLTVGSGADDLAVMSGGKFTRVAHPSVLDGSARTAAPVVALDSTSAPVLSAALARMSPDTRFGVITADGEAAPKIARPEFNGISFNVNTASDTNDSLATSGRCTTNIALTCSLRDAINLSTQSPSGPNTINVPSGTYTITVQNTFSDNLGSANYHFDVDSNVSIVGAGASSTIINANNLDKVMSLNSSNNLGANSNFFAYSIALTGLTLENGKNTNGTSANDLGGNFDWEADNGSLTLTNVTSTGGNAIVEGGGAYGDNYYGTASDNSTLSATGCTFSSNKAVNQAGGIGVFNGLVLSLSSSTVTGNTVTDASGTGGGIVLMTDVSRGNATIESSIANSTISSNTNPSYEGGGLYATLGASISGSTFTGNSAGLWGGGIYFFSQTTSSSVVDSTFTGNSVTDTSGTTGPPDGGAIFVGSGANPSLNAVGISYSRFHGNTAGSGDLHTAVGVGNGQITTAGYGGQVTATDNWWGCNPTSSATSVSGTNCDTAGANTGTTSSFSANPYTSLNLTLSSTTPTGAASFSATGSMAQNSSGTAYTGTEDNALSGVAATLVITQPDSAATTDSGTLSATDAISESATPDTNKVDYGPGTASVTVDGFTVTAPFTLEEPDLTVSSSHTGTFVAGSAGNTYTLTVSNIGNSASSGTVTVVDTLPSGFTATGLTGTGWSCTLGTLTCTRSDPLGAAPPYPAISVTVTAATISGSYSNSVTVSGGAELDAGNDTGTDSTIVIAASVAKFSVTGLGPFTAPGSAGSATVAALDTYDNTVTSFTGTVAVTSNDTDALLPANYTYTAGDNGVHAFSVTLNTAGTFSVTATATAGGYTGSETGITVEDAVWLLNGTMQLEHINSSGSTINQTSISATASSAGSIAFDNTGNAWVVGNTDNDVYVYSHVAATVSSGTTGGGLSSPASIAIDGLGNAWIANGNNTISEFTNGRTAVTPSTGYLSGSGKLSTPTGLIIDNAGSIWITNSGNNTVTKIIGGAAPVVTPTITGTANNTLGTRP